MRQFLPWAAALTLGPAVAFADDAAGWLLKVSDAANQASYQGVVVYRDSGQRMEVMRLTHRQHDGRVQERLTSLTGSPRDVLREGGRVVFAAGEQPMQSAGSATLFPVLSQELLTQAANHYEYRYLGEARVAGRPCRGVLMSPRDEFRYGYEICGDLQTAVPLRVTLLDRAGRTVEQLMFTEIAFPARIADSAFAPPTGATPAAAGSGSATPAVEAKETWRLVTLPPGFRVVRRELMPSPDGRGMIEHVQLTDGLSAVSVFGVRDGTPDKAFRGLSSMGAMNAYGRHVGTFHITVVGEVPPGTVRMIGDGFAEPEAAAAQPDNLTD